MTYLSLYQSPVGELTLASDGENLTGLWMEGQKYFGSTLEPRTEMREDLEIFQAAGQWLDAYFSGGKPEISDRLSSLSEADFVWKYGGSCAAYHMGQ